MGCGVSKEDEQLVILCRDRKDLIRAAADHRYALASAHVAYFRSLAAVGDALRRFVEEELVIVSPSASPELTLPSERKINKKKNKGKYRNTDRSIDHKNSSSSTSLSHSGSGSHIHLSDDDNDHDGDGSHLHLSSGSDTEHGSSSGHIHIHDSPNVEVGESSYSIPPLQSDWGQYGENPPPWAMGWGPYGAYPPPPEPAVWGSDGLNSSPQSAWDQYRANSTTYSYYMKRSAPQVHSVIYDPTKSPATGQSSYSSYPYENGGFFGFPMRSPPPGAQNQRPSPPAGPPPPPSPKASAWDFLNPFDGYDNGYPDYYNSSKFTYGSIASSPDSTEVREREGIPELEDETETEAYREVRKGKKNLNDDNDMKGSSGEGTSNAVPSQKQSNEGSSRAVPSYGSSESTTRGGEWTSKGVATQNSEESHAFDVKKEDKSSPDSITSKSTEDGSVRKKGVTFEGEAVSMHNAESPKLSNMTKLSAHGTRDLQDVVAEIRDEFAMASGYGKEVTMLLEVDKLPYQPRFTIFKVILSRIRFMVAPSHSSSRRSVRFARSSVKLEKPYYEDSRKNTNMKSSNLSSTLEKLYMWEKKLYKEVKDEERIRVIYERQLKRLKVLDDRGAESSKIDAAQASVRKSLTKISVCIKAVDAISSRIHKLRDEELQPQITQLIYGLVRMWNAMLKCHQKQFQAIKECKSRSLRANIGSRRDSNLRATLELEMELRTWCSHFSTWITTQKSFVDSLNGWLLMCLSHQPEVTPDGIVPFSPGRIGAPPIFVVCNDWSQAMETISETEVASAMSNFASSLQQLWEKQDDEQRQRLKAEYASKDFERRLRSLRMARGKMERDHEVMSDRTGGSLVPSESGVSPLDDLKVDLDSMRHKLEEERTKHKEAAKLVHRAVSGSLEAGLVPIFEALDNFTSKVVEAYSHVRIEDATQQQKGK